MADACMSEKVYHLAFALLPPEKQPGPQGGRPPIAHRTVLKINWFVLVTGCRWDDVPKETRQPLKDQLDDLLGRIRLGDNPQQVFRGLAESVPLETFTLFATSLVVHWEVGGSLTPTLAMVGRTIRDRIEIARRIRRNTAQSQLSTVFILLLTYFIAAIVWRNNPEQMQAFVRTEIGSYSVAGSMVLQCAGVVWMNWIGKARF